MRPNALTALAAVVFAITSCSDTSGPVSPDDAPQPSAAADVAAPTADVIPDQYIVVFAGDVTDASGLARRLAAAHGATLLHSYGHTLKGFAGRMSAPAAAAIARSPQVAYVEADQIMRAVTTETNATWGIDRIDQRSLPLTGAFTYTNSGSGVTAYIIDTGIRFDHTEFGGRAVSGVDEVTVGGTAADCNGHGTHVSGTVGGATYGVAKAVRLVAVRVLGCGGSGSNSGVIAGVDWVTADHQAGQPAVANMSLGGSASTALDDAVRRSVADGVTYAIAAGNGFFGLFAQNACNTSPARVAEALTVSATDKTDTKPSWANVGSCVDLFAPGINISSAWSTSASATNTISGTSMATPHVAGVAALYLQGTTAATPAAVASALIGSATTGIVKSAGSGSPNRLLFTTY